jgi:leader peptidase (prepilin peptidase)/N-methyltransferase
MTELVLFLQNYLYPFVVGACIGSFLNVCIYRMPLNLSIAYPSSYCAACGTSLKLSNNIPLLSWLIQRGRCSYCDCKIDARYFIVELLTAIWAVVLWNLYPLDLAIIYFVFSASLIVATFIDIDHFIIPDEISLGGAAVGIILCGFFPVLQNQTTILSGISWSFLSFLFGGGVLFIIAIVGTILLKKEAMGMGDIKLLAMMGAFLGWKACIFIIGFSSIFGSIIGLALLIPQKKFRSIPMPFGPSLALAAFLWLLVGQEWMQIYLDYITIR